MFAAGEPAAVPVKVALNRYGLVEHRVGIETGLFGQLAPRRGERSLAGLDAAAGWFPDE